MTTFLSFLLDIVLPGVGMLLLDKTSDGAKALIVWAYSLACLIWAVGCYDLDPIRAFFILATIYFFLVVFLLSVKRPRTYRARPFVASMGILAFMCAIFLFYEFGPVFLVSVKGHGVFPGLTEGEVIIVNRSLTRALERGDLVVARLSDSTVIARVVGLPKERITISGPSLVIDDTTVPSTALGLLKIDDVPVPEIEKRNLEGFEEQLGSKRHLVFFRRDVSLLPVTYEVPEGHIFLLADNRSTLNVVDSREYGAVSISDIIGRPGQVVWSRLDRIGYMWK